MGLICSSIYRRLVAGQRPFSKNLNGLTDAIDKSLKQIKSQISSMSPPRQTKAHAIEQARKRSRGSARRSLLDDRGARRPLPADDSARVSRPRRGPYPSRARPDARAGALDGVRDRS